jgi:retron-type reverse transcriptase
LQERQYETAVPTVRDRVVQAALKIVLEPIFEADFAPCSFGFRPKRSTHHALNTVMDEAWAGRRVVVEADIASFLGAWSHCSFR